MAYSDYGGYAYRNGERVRDRSDYTVTPDCGGFGTPGAYPAFALIEGGMSVDEAKKYVDYPHHHAVIGDGPFYVGLHKQSDIHVYNGVNKIDLVRYAPDVCIREWDGNKYFTLYSIYDNLAFTDRPIVMRIDGNKIEVVADQSDNYYLYVRLTQPDGVIWTAFSGYGVGEGLEDCGYGFSTQKCVDHLHRWFGGEK